MKNTNQVDCSCGCQTCGCEFKPCAVTCFPTYPITSDYAYIYNTGAATVAVGDAVAFSENGIISNAVARTAGTPEITIAETGVYLITAYASTTAGGTITLYRNGTAVAGTTYSSTETVLYGQAVFYAQRGDVLTLVNTGTAEITLAENTAAQPVTNVSVTLTKLL